MSFLTRTSERGSRFAAFGRRIKAGKKTALNIHYYNECRALISKMKTGQKHGPWMQLYLHTYKIELDEGKNQKQARMNAEWVVAKEFKVHPRTVQNVTRRDHDFPLPSELDQLS